MHFLVTLVAIVGLCRETSATHIRFFGGYGMKVQMFETRDFTSCTDLPDYLVGRFSAIKTDVCVMLYMEKGCSRSDESVQITTIDQFMFVETLVSKQWFSSFHQCNETIGGSQVNVDFFYKSADNAGEGMLAVQYRDLCKCQVLWGIAISSVDNYGNCIEVYQDDACSTNATQILGGNSLTSRDFRKYGISDLRSVKFCNEPFHCLKSNATVVKIEIQPSQDKKLLQLSKTSDMQLSAKATFKNNGSAIVTQEYAVKKGIETTMSITRVKSLSTTNSVKVGVDVQIEQKFGIPLVEKTKLSIGFSVAYNYERTSASEDSQTYTKTETTEFEASQKIEIPPCSTYEVDSFVTIKQNFPITYTVYVQYSALSGDQWLPPAELRKKLYDMVWIQDVNEYTILAKGKSTAMADFGLQAFITGSGSPIEGCVK